MMIEEGTLARFCPSEDLTRLFSEKTARMLEIYSPIVGMVTRADPPIGLLSFMADGRKQSIPVFLHELEPIGRPKA